MEPKTESDKDSSEKDESYQNESNRVEHLLEQFDKNRQKNGFDDKSFGLAFKKVFIDEKNMAEDTESNKGEEEKEKGKNDSKNKNKNQRHNKSKFSQHFLISIANSNIPNKSDEEIPDTYKIPQDNILSEKQSKKLNNNSELNNLSKKTTRSNTGQKKSNINKKQIFKTHKKGKLSDIKTINDIRKFHDKTIIDNKIPKTKSFIFRIIVSAFNKISDEQFDKKKYNLNQICGEQVNNRTVQFNKELLNKKLIDIINNAEDNNNKNIINITSGNEKIDRFLELKLKDFFNYLRNKERNGVVETINLIETEEDQSNFPFLDQINFYELYQDELDKRNDDDKKIIRGQINEGFVNLINGRKSKKITKKGK